MASSLVKFQSDPCTRVQGDVNLWCLLKMRLWFQSAPCTRVQGDLPVRNAMWWNCPFQSAPCTRVQGDAAQLQIAVEKTSFNPLPAPEYREILLRHRVRATPSEFQSAPCTRVQGDYINLISCATLNGVSIRSLHQSTGRSYQAFKSAVQVAHYRVSIRSLHQSTGRFKGLRATHDSL